MPDTERLLLPTCVHCKCEFDPDDLHHTDPSQDDHWPETEEDHANCVYCQDTALHPSRSRLTRLPISISPRCWPA